MSFTVSNKNKGIDIKISDFCKYAKRCGIWLDAKAVDRSAVTKARKKIKWEAFEDLNHNVVNFAYKVWEDSPEDQWHNMNVYGVDGSKFNLPGTKEIREVYDPRSGPGSNSKGYFPQCLVSTAYDVFRRFPVARTVVKADSSEREEAKKLIPLIPPSGVILFDRGYPSFEMFDFLNKNYSGYYIFRCPATSTFKAVQDFVKSDEEESILYIAPSDNYVRNNKSAKNEHIKVRVIKLRDPEGKLSVLITNLLDAEEFSKEEIVELYFRRWEVETYYLNEKVYIEIEKFHSRSINGVLQELFAAMVMSVITRILIKLTTIHRKGKKGVPQFKNTLMAIAFDLAILISDNFEKALKYFDELLDDIFRVRYYKPVNKRKSQPRVTKKAQNKWTRNRGKKLANVTN